MEALRQWVSANARIMSKLIANGTLSDTRDLLDCREYTSRVGDLVQTHTVPSVMEFRQDQAAAGSRWSEYNWHACLFHLEKRASRTGAKQPAKRRVGTRKTMDKSGKFFVWITTMNQDASVPCAAIRMYVQRRAVRLHTHSTNMALSTRSTSAPATPSQHV